MKLRHFHVSDPKQSKEMNHFITAVHRCFKLKGVTEVLDMYKY